jgi:hypothetical protein
MFCTGHEFSRKEGLQVGESGATEKGAVWDTTCVWNVVLREMECVVFDVCFITQYPPPPLTILYSCTYLTTEHPMPSSMPWLNNASSDRTCHFVLC